MKKIVKHIAIPSLVLHRIDAVEIATTELTRICNSRLLPLLASMYPVSLNKYSVDSVTQQ
jgi:hypothetical protein